MAAIVSALDGGPAEVEAILSAIGRNARLAGHVEVMAGIRRLVNRDDVAPSLIPVLRWPVIRDAEVVSVVLHSWPRLAQPHRLLAIEALLARPALVDVADPREQVLQVLRRGVTDPSVAVRDRTLRGINALPALWGSKRSASLVMAALTDDTPALRRLGLSLAATKPDFWRRADAREYLKRLLIDPDRQVRNAALETVEQQSLIRAEPAMARRVKVLETDPELARRAGNSSTSRVLTTHRSKPMHASAAHGS